MKKLFLGPILFLLFSFPLFSLDVSLDSVEIDVVVFPNGKAAIYYSTQWTTYDGTMSGFYFQGEQASPRFNLSSCFADLDDGSRVPLEIIPMDDNTYDIILEDDKRFEGTAMYFFNYGVDFADYGYIGKTESSEFGELFYFHWAPVQWEYAMEHRTVRVVLPIIVETAEITQEFLQSINFRTEQFVNEQNKIDYYTTQGDDGSYYFSILFHQDNVGVKQKQEIQFYLQQNAITITDTELKTKQFPLISDERIWYLIIFGAIIGIAVLILMLKNRGFSGVVERVEGIRWAGNNWVPPKLIIGTYGKKDKIVENLHPIEAALLLYLPLPRIVAIMLEGLTRQGIIELVAENPLQIKIISANLAKHEYEEFFLQAFDTQVRVLSGVLSDFFEKVLARLQEKVWDCDAEATKAYYRKKLEQEQDDTREYAVYWSSYHAIYYHEHYYANLALPRELSTNYQEFMSSASCFEGCFNPPAFAS